MSTTTVQIAGKPVSINTAVLYAKTFAYVARLGGSERTETTGNVNANDHREQE